MVDCLLQSFLRIRVVDRYADARIGFVDAAVRCCRAAGEPKLATLTGAISAFCDRVISMPPLLPD
jgi:hypothetical protein